MKISYLNLSNQNTSIDQSDMEKSVWKQNRFQGTVMPQSEICESKLSRNIAGLFVLDNSWVVEKK